MRKKNKSRYAVLGLLSTGPMSGYDIKKRFEKIASNFWNESYGQIYPILKRLNSEGLATKAIEKQEGKPDRHIYTLTLKGQKKLMQWLKEPVDHQIGQHEILLKLFFGSMNPVMENINQIRHLRALHEKELSDLQSVREQMENEKTDSHQLLYRLMTIRFGELVNEAFLQWSRETIGILEKMNDK